MAAQLTESVPAVDRVLTILELLENAPAGLALPDLVTRTSIPKSSVHCLLVTLERRGYLRRNRRTGRYVFGIKVLSLANAALRNIAIREIAAGELRSLAEATGLVVHLAIFDNGEAVLVSKHEPPGSARLATWMGKRMGIHCTSVGKAVIAYLPEDTVDSIIRQHGLPRYNDNTLSTAKKLKADLAEIVKRGYSLDDEEEEIGLRCIGAPIFDPAGSPVAAVSVSGSVDQVTGDNLHRLAQIVKATAGRITDRLMQASQE